ncbi:MAG: hypothetical protein ACOH1T_07650 [Microbacteriaceae bacterium]
MTNPLGKISFFLGVSIVVFEVVFSVVRTSIIATENFSLVGAIGLVQSIVVGVLAVAAVITGLIALTRVGLPRGFAAAGTALGGMALINVATGLLNSALLQTLSR